MAEEKVNRNNHPILVKARHDSYWAGRSDGYKDGYAEGYSENCDKIHNFYRISIHALEIRVEAQQEEIRRLREVLNNGRT